MTKVLVSDPIDQAGIDILSQVAQVDVRTGLPPEELKAIEKEIDAEVADCVEFALAAPEPKPEELTRYIWAED